MNAAPIRILPMTRRHLDQVSALEEACFPTPWSRDLLSQELENALSAFLVALDGDDRVAGYAGVQVILDEGHITTLAVRPECRRRGIARQLLQVFSDFARGSGLACLTLEVRSSNAPAIALYAALGFCSVGRRKNYYEHPREDAIIMTKEFDGNGASHPLP